MSADLSNWQWRAPPDLKPTAGRYVKTEPAQFPDAATELFPVLCSEGDADLWTYIPLGPFETAESFGETMRFVTGQQNWQTHMFRDAATNAPLGMASYMRIRPEAGSVEVGCIVLSKKLQRTAAATEAMYLMARHVFDDLGYRRYEWKCNNDNAASRRAALRLGFTFEGVFRQDMVMKGRNRDTAWYSMLDSEWPAVKAAFESWLASDNFDGGGQQRRSLADIRAAI
ncbi:GNAT family protein [Hyphococcus flavus]|uniref:GNAT family protein n=1 Tax=Hyphococcus flavus TaxID=1866326 RepID=A0AAF0CGJ5_9PROT|nr:GNAT family protein [Hyphococcus flavus]WDI32444.1 GNAT family protein [Hyphococcus flavus]